MENLDYSATGGAEGADLQGWISRERKVFGGRSPATGEGGVNLWHGPHGVDLQDLVGVGGW